jgi:hypothetical protein
MSDIDDVFGPEGPDTPDISEQGSAPEAGELQLRKALATMNDLEPPRDDLFVQRALLRGRARTSRRRSAVFGAAAALVVVGAVGTAWLTNHSTSSTTANAGSAAVAPEAASGSDSSGTPQVQRGTGDRSGPKVAPSDVPPAREASTWFGALATPQTASFDAVEQQLVTRWPNVFSGAYAADATGSRIVVTVTRHDPALEALVRGAMPAPGDVSFVVVRHSYAEKARVLQQVDGERAAWRAKGVQILGVAMDARDDAVAVLADEGGAPGQLARRYGDLVRVVPSTAIPTGKLPDGSTLPPLQR